MSLRRWSLLVPLLLATVPAAAALGELSSETSQLLVGYDEGRKNDVVRALANLNVRVNLELDPLRVVRVSAPDTLDASAILKLAGVAFVEADMGTRAAGAQWNGAQWNGAQWNGAQWNGEVGVDNGSAWGHAAVASAPAWEIEAGSRAADVCVVDSGVDGGHEDLAAHALGGWSFVDDTSDASDPAGHGTHMAGIVAAVRGNGVGVAGVTQSGLLSARVLSADGTGKVSQLAEGMVWCANEGADVMLLALSVDGRSRTIARAIEYATARDVVMVASAGNGGCGGCVSFPASDPRVIAVGAVASDLSSASFSSRGAEVELSAPGVEIVSTFPADMYASGSGTSQAAAWVAGAAALVREHRPDLSAEGVREALVVTAKDLGAEGRDPAFGAGLLDLERALARVGS